MSFATNAIDVDMRGLDPVRALVVGVPPGAELSAGRLLEDGIWELEPRHLYGLRIARPLECESDIDLAVHLFTIDLCDGVFVERAEIRHVRVEIDAALDFVAAADRRCDRSLTFV